MTERRKTFRISMAMSDDDTALNVHNEVAYFDTDDHGNLVMVVYGGPDATIRGSVTFQHEDLQNFIDEMKSSLDDPTQPGKYRALNPKT